MTNTYYHFISSARQGLAAAIDTDLEDGQKRASIEVLLNIARKSKVTGEWDETSSVQRSVQLYGPGDVVGFYERIVARTDPRPDSGNFEPNYFPLIEFADFDFPWRYSPVPANDDKGLAPWIVLIALIAEGQEMEYEQVVRASSQVPVIKVYDQRNLPDVENAWRWAHVQATAGVELLDAGQLKSMYETQPECLVSRLLCPRRLQPKTLYTAFIVPAFKLGWAAGLGDDVSLNSVIESTANDPAWDNQSSESIELPYYYRWDFRTSLRGDFEHLVRLLVPRELKGLGLRKMDCQHPGFGLSVQLPVPEYEGENHILELEGALQSSDTTYTPWGKDKNGPLDSLESGEYPTPEEFQKSLAVEVLNKANPGSLVRSCKVNPEIASAEEDKITFKSPVKTISPATDTGSIAELVLKSISFNALPDGKSVRVSWQTPFTTTGRISYGVVKPSGNVTYDHIRNADTSARTHSVTIDLAPEKMYKLKLTIINQDLAIEFDAITASLYIPLPAVVPPIYGRWHAARSSVNPGKFANDWLNVLNLDPRHRTAAGLGSEVVRKQQEALMSSAWDQIGDIETANDILQRAQQSRESGIFLYDRLGELALEDYLRVTAPVQKRILREQNGGPKQTIRTELEQSTLIPPAAIDPAFRRISRPRGPLRKRQKQHRTDLLRRLATGEIQPAGEPPKIMGTKTPCDVTKEMMRGFVPTISIRDVDLKSIDCKKVGEHYAATLNLSFSWESSNIIGQLHASGNWGGDFPPQPEDPVQILTSKAITFVGDSSDEDHPGLPDYNYVDDLTGGTTSLSGDPSISSPDEECPDSQYFYPITYTFILAGESLAYGRTTRLEVTISDFEHLENATIHTTDSAPYEKAFDETALRFCDERITCDDLCRELDKGVKGVSIENDLRDAICDTFSNFLIPEEEPARPSERKQPYLEDLRNSIHAAIDPRKTIVERVKRRLNLSGDLAKRFEEDAEGDPLEGIRAYPVFPQPMYEPLKELSESHVLPGVEKVPQNTISVLETNRRYIESYMVGLNHEFSAELLWRGFPTDQRGSYFRQFWDISDLVPISTGRWGASPAETPEHLKDICPLTEWDQSHLGVNVPRTSDDDANNDEWYQSQPGIYATPSIDDNADSDEEVNRAVLVIRGDLLKRYPNAVIYAVNARLEHDANNRLTGNFIPDLAEFTVSPSSVGESVSPTTNWASGISRVNESDGVMRIAETVESVSILDLADLPPDPGHADHIDWIFKGSLGADLVFFGFPFSIEEAKSSSETTGKFFIFEERITETRFGLDLGDEAVPDQDGSDETSDTTGDETLLITSWDNLSWADLQLIDQTGKYLDSSPIDIRLEDSEGVEGETWDANTSASLRARITMQRPVRLAIHADQMIP